MLFIACHHLAGSLLMNYEHAAEVLNFGAFIAFMGVNLTVVRVFYRRGRRAAYSMTSPRPLQASSFARSSGSAFRDWLRRSEQRGSPEGCCT